MDTPRLTVRPATTGDAAAVLDIYRNFILNTTVTFEEEVPTLEQFRARVADIMAEYPFLVCDDGGRIAGYIYAHRHQPRSAYRYGAEISVYLRPHYTGLGIGRILCDTMLELLRRQGVQIVYSAISLPNERSCALHEAAGFRQTGIWCKTGYKKGRWIDVALYELAIGDFPAQPEPLKTFDQLDTASVAGILTRANERLSADTE